MAYCCTATGFSSQHHYLHSCALSHQRMSPYLLQHQYLDDAQSVNTISADYDRIAGLFEDIASCLEGFKILEGCIPPIPELNLALARVLTSVLVLCGICAKYGKMSRFSKYILCILGLQKTHRMIPLDVSTQNKCVRSVPRLDSVRLSLDIHVFSPSYLTIINGRRKSISESGPWGRRRTPHGP